MQFFRPFLFGMLGGLIGFFVSLLTLVMFWSASV